MKKLLLIGIMLFIGVSGLLIKTVIDYNMLIDNRIKQITDLQISSIVSKNNASGSGNMIWGFDAFIEVYKQLKPDIVYYCRKDTQFIMWFYSDSNYIATYYEQAPYNFLSWRDIHEG